MKRKMSKILTGLTALVLFMSLKVLPVSAVEYIIEEEPLIGDIKIYPMEDEKIEAVGNFADETFTVELSGDEISLYDNDGIQPMDAESDSAIYHGSVSGYLSGTGEYELYSVSLPADSYLQARLAVPDNTSINYALVLYDSSLNVIKMSHYIPYLNDGSTLEESVGYLAASDELIYMGVFALVGGSTTEAYTLDFSIVTNYSGISDSGEPNENVEEAAVMNLGRAGATVSGMINSPLDNDWYSFTVLKHPTYNTKHPDYNKMRLSLSQASSTNGYKMEIYNNLADDYYAMQLVAEGTGEGELDLPAGTYYVRVVSTNTFDNFEPGNLAGYSLSVVPVSRVDGIEIRQYQGSGGVIGKAYDLPDEPNWINIVGLAYYQEGETNITGSANVKLKITVVNTSWEKYDRPDLATTYATVITGDDGFFYRTVNLNDGLGLHNLDGDFYDRMNVEICLLYNPEKKITSSFSLVKKYS